MEVARVNEPFSFGAPERRRFATQFGYDMRPSFWQQVRSNSHVVIAAVGTAALLCVAAVALWLALPANDRQANANSQQTVPAIPVKTKKIAPAATVASAAAPRAARKADEVSPAVAAREAEIPALAPNDPRWTGSESKTVSSSAAATSDEAASESTQERQPAQQAAKPSVAAFSEAAAQTDATTQLSEVAAPNKAATDHPPDGAETAAIPASEPSAGQTAAADAGQAKAEPQNVAAAGIGRIVKDVTMRTGPKNSAAAVVTIPAKTSVQVVSCKQWCQIVHNGKRGWVYKSYVKTGV
jgi:hypothetical protein